MRTAVVLPAPLRPRSAQTLPERTSKLTSTSAWVWPNERARRSTEIAAEVMPVEFRSLWSDPAVHDWTSPPAPSAPPPRQAGRTTGRLFPNRLIAHPLRRLRRHLPGERGGQQPTPRARRPLSLRALAPSACPAD